MFCLKTKPSKARINLELCFQTKQTNPKGKARVFLCFQRFKQKKGFFLFSKKKRKPKLFVSKQKVFCLFSSKKETNIKIIIKSFD